MVTYQPTSAARAAAAVDRANHVPAEVAEASAAQRYSSAKPSVERYVTQHLQLRVRLPVSSELAHIPSEFSK